MYILGKSIKILEEYFATTTRLILVLSETSNPIEQVKVNV